MIRINPRHKVRVQGGGAPEHLLLLAVLEEALHCYQKYLLATKGRPRRLFREAEEWITSGDSDLLFSFEHICMVVGLDPSYIRRTLYRWRDREIANASDAQKHLCQQPISC